MNLGPPAWKSDVLATTLQTLYKISEFVVCFSGTFHFTRLDSGEQWQYLFQNLTYIMNPGYNGHYTEQSKTFSYTVTADGDSKF